MNHALTPFAVVLLLALVPAQQAAVPNAAPPSLLPPLEQVVRAFDCATTAPLEFAALLDRLAAQEVVFLGETHIDDTTHRVELAVLEGLLQRRPGKVVLSLEMFERDVQGVLDDYLQGRLDEAAFLHRARPWGNYRADYRPLIEAARAAKIPVVAANFPAALRRKLGQGGKAAFEALSPTERALLPAAIFPASDAYWQRVERATRGHMGGGVSSAEERLYDAQNLWDNSMGDAVAAALAAHPDHVVLHVAGGFHVAYRDGTVAQFARRRPDGKAVVVQIAVAAPLHAARPDRERDEADFLVYAESLARSENDGTYAVEVPAELRYLLHVPAEVAAPPLLVWLPDRATRAQDALSLLTVALGAEAAIAVVQQPFPELQEDLALGGRYAFGDGFRADYGRAAHGVERIVEYVARRCGADPGRAVIAGAGDGAATVLWASLYGQWFAGDLLAVDPTDLTRLSMEALPDRPPAMRALQLLAHAVPAERLQKVAADYQKVGASATATAFDGSDQALLQALRARLGLPASAAPTAGAEVRLVLDAEVPRAREWAGILAARLRGEGTAARVVLAAELEAGADPTHLRRLRIGSDGQWPVAAFADGQGLPLAGGPFGGTTVLVLPDGTSDDDRKLWQEHEQKKVIKRRSMFANLAIAGAGAPTLPETMAALKQRGRSRVLIVPAVFCADAATMRALQQQLGTSAQGMDVAWLPGLGAELVQ